MKLTNKGKAVLGFGLTALITGISTFCLVWLMGQHPDYTSIFLGMAVITTIIFFTTWVMMWLCLFTNMVSDDTDA